MDTSDIEMSDVQISKALEENQISLALEKDKLQHDLPDESLPPPVVVVVDDTPNTDTVPENYDNKQNIDDIDCDIVEDEEVIAILIFFKMLSNFVKFIRKFYNSLVVVVSLVGLLRFKCCWQPKYYRLGSQP